jgi:hypothetical protein
MKMLGLSPDPPALPPPPKPTPMVDEVAIAKARKKAAVDLQNRSGRSSTILGSAEKLGG